jgi:hypothetical protein
MAPRDLVRFHTFVDDKVGHCILVLSKAYAEVLLIFEFFCPIGA